MSADNSSSAAFAWSVVDSLCAIDTPRARVFVPVHGSDDTFYTQVSKSEARRIVRDANGQLEAQLHSNGAVYIEARSAR